MPQGQPPGGLAKDGRAENPRQYPPGTYPGSPGASSADAGTGLLAAEDAPEASPQAGARYNQPPYGFAIDGRPENPRVFPPPAGPQGHPGNSS